MKLVYLNGESSGCSYDLKQPATTLGRETDNDIQLLVGGVSRYHAVFEYSENLWTLRDLGSTNGTNLNGSRLEKAEKISHGDIIVIGDQRLRVEDELFSPRKDEEQNTTLELSSRQILFRPPSEPAKPDGRTASLPLEKPPVEEPEQAESPIFVRPPAPRSKPPVEPEPEVAYTPPIDGNIFGGVKDPSSDSAHKQGHSAVSRRSSLRNNIIFGSLIIILAGIVLAVFIKLNNKQDTTVIEGGASASGGKPAIIENPFVLCYERMIIDGTSIFRFSLEIENGMFTIALDDIGSDSNGVPVRRKHSKSFSISEKYIEELKKDITESKFFSAQSLPMPGQKNYRRIIAGFDDKFNDIAVLNPNESREFMRLERSIEDFISVNYIPGIFQTQEENYAEAIRVFTNADDAYATCLNNAQPYRLNEAVRGYKLAEKMFGLFSPPPAQYEQIRPKLAEAEQELARIEKEHNMRINMFLQQRDYDSAINTCNELMKYYADDTGSSAYRSVRERRMELTEAKLKREKKGK